MIQLPRRSVTRFFIPLIDVLLLLFCIFLLMPLVKGSGDEPADDTELVRQERLRKLEEELERLRRQLGTPQDVRAELEKLRQEKMQVLQEKLAIRVLEIDAATGKLYHRDPDRIEIDSQAKAAELIDQDRTRRGAGKAELYYLILYPRDPASPYPLRKQRERYDLWFADAAHGWDTLQGLAGRTKP